MYEVKLPSGAVVALREPTGLDQERAIKAATRNRELVALAEVLIMDYCIETINGKQPQNFTVDVLEGEVRPTTLLTLNDLQALTEIFQSMFMLSDKDREKYRDYGKKLIGGTSTLASTKSK